MWMSRCWKDTELLWCFSQESAGCLSAATYLYSCLSRLGCFSRSGMANRWHGCCLSSLLPLWQLLVIDHGSLSHEFRRGSESSPQSAAGSQGQPLGVDIWDASLLASLIGIVRRGLLKIPQPASAEPGSGVRAVRAPLKPVLSYSLLQTPTGACYVLFLTFNFLTCGIGTVAP